MLRKCIKHEFIASYRNYIPVYAAMYILSVMIYFSFQIDNTVILSLAIGLFSLVFGAMSIFIIYNLVLSLGSRIYGKPGYLLFSIPAKTYEIMLSKFIVNFIWIVVSTFVAVSAMGIAFSVLGIYVDIADLFQMIYNGLDLGVSGIILLILFGIIYASYLIAFFMFLFALLNLIYKGERKILIGVLLYFALNFAMNIIINAFSLPLLTSILGGGGFNFGILWFYLGLYFVITCTLIGFTYYFMNKKMELQ